MKKLLIFALLLMSGAVRAQDALSDRLTTLRQGFDSRKLDAVYDQYGKDPAAAARILDTLLSIRRDLPPGVKKDSLPALLTYYLGAYSYDLDRYGDAIRYAKEGNRLDRKNYTFDYIHGISLMALGTQARAQGDKKHFERLYNQALDEFDEAVKKYPRSPLGFIKNGTWEYPSRVCRYMGYLYMNLAVDAPDGWYREECLEKANLNFDRVHETYLLTPTFFFNRILTLCALAEYKEPATADSLYRHEAQRLLGHAARRAPQTFESYYFWGGCLQDMADLRRGLEADSLYRESIHKLEKAVQLTGDTVESKMYRNCLDALQYAYGRRSMMAPRDQAADLLATGLAWGDKAIALGAAGYHRACLYAVMNDRPAAFNLLRTALEAREIEFSRVESDRCWNPWRFDREYKTLKRRYK